MSERVIPLVDQRIASLAAPVPAQPVVADGLLSDALGRPLSDLRISVTDRCNFRCNYCMPKEVFDKDYPYLPHGALLSFEEITRTAKLFVAHGVRKIRLTGGEPLLRKNIEVLIEQLAALRTPDGQPLDLTLTTNGSLLARKAKSLKAAGPEAGDREPGRAGRRGVPRDERRGLSRRRRAGRHRGRATGGLGSGEPGHSLKINMVVKRGTNEHEILRMARHFRGTGIVLRFIEYMDVGATNGWRMDEVLPSADVVKLIHAELPLVQLDPSAPGETAERWGYADASGRHDPALGEVGVISSVTQAFCRDCNRARLSTEGKLYLCLFAGQGYDLRALLRGGASDEDIASAIGAIWQVRSDRYSELRSTLAPDTGAATRRVEMSYIGG
jgi:cyclic pyranopterin phosphate synthase